MDSKLQNLVFQLQTVKFHLLNDYQPGLPRNKSVRLTEDGELRI